jgi:hypothetical protein
MAKAAPSPPARVSPRVRDFREREGRKEMERRELSDLSDLSDLKELSDLRESKASSWHVEV